MKYTPEQVEAMADAYFQDTENVDQCGDMLRAYAATLRQAARVDEGAVTRACNAYFDALPVMGGEAANREAMNAALEAALSAQPRAVPETWHPMETAPCDGTMLRLLVQFEDHATEDTTGPAPTIGAYEEGADGWRFAGWCWSHDHFTEGKGAPVGWLPMLADVAAPVGVPDEMVVEVEVVPLGIGMRRLDFSIRDWWHKLPDGKYRLYARSIGSTGGGQ